MVYPNRVIANLNWDTNTGIDILLALGENDGLYVYNTKDGNLLHLGMPSEVVNCELRVRGVDSLYNPPLNLYFYRGNSLVYTTRLFVLDNWVTFTLTVDRWDSVELIADDGGTLGVDFLRAEPFGGLPSRRTLTGVGI